MAKVKCRCGNEVLFEPAPGAETVKVLCHRCGSRIRVHLGKLAQDGGDAAKKSDGYIRFFCPCGRRLKVIAKNPMPSHGRCPDCGRTVPVPAQDSGNASNPAESPTAELSQAEATAMQEWRKSFEK